MDELLMKILGGLAHTKLLRTPDEYRMFYCLFCDGPETVFDEEEGSAYGFVHDKNCIVTLARRLVEESTE